MESATNRLQSIGSGASLDPITLPPSLAVTHQSRHFVDLRIQWRLMSKDSWERSEESARP